MAANAGTKLYKVVENVERLLSIELLAAAQALSFRTKKSSILLEKVVEDFRQVVPVMKADRIFGDDMSKALTFIQQYDLERIY
jgi:histidine ammonia-lyase